jgi:hypothetical protein
MLLTHRLPGRQDHCDPSCTPHSHTSTPASPSWRTSGPQLDTTSGPSCNLAPRYTPCALHAYHYLTTASNDTTPAFSDVPSVTAAPAAPAALLSLQPLLSLLLLLRPVPVARSASTACTCHWGCTHCLAAPPPPQSPPAADTPSTRRTYAAAQAAPLRQPLMHHARCTAAATLLAVACWSTQRSALKPKQCCCAYEGPAPSCLLGALMHCQYTSGYSTVCRLVQLGPRGLYGTSGASPGSAHTDQALVQLNSPTALTCPPA